MADSTDVAKARGIADLKGRTVHVFVKMNAGHLYAVRMYIRISQMELSFV